MDITIYHNPRCSKSRRTLELLRERGVEPRVVEYLEDTPDSDTLLRLASLLGKPMAALVRPAEAREAGGKPDGDEEAVAVWLTQHPRALQRPIVVDEERGKAVLGRPPENVLDLLAGR